MSANTSPIFPLTPYVASANLTAITACATRAPIASANLATNNIIQLTATSSNGLRIDKIQAQGASTSITAPTAAQLVQIWYFDGTTAWLQYEIPMTVITPSTTAVAFNGVYYPLNMVLPSTGQLYVSTTVTTTAATTAFVVTAWGGSY